MPSRATEYAEGVQSGKIVACPKIEAVTKWHLDCLEKSLAGKFWCRFDEREAAKPVALCRELLSVKSMGKRVPFDPVDWQAFLLESWNGWRVDTSKVPDPLSRLDGTRRFRRVFLLAGKGAGKSPVSVPMIIQVLAEERDSIGICAGSVEEQSRRPWEELRDMALADETGVLDAMYEFQGGKKTGDQARFRSRDGRSTARFQCVGSQSKPEQFSGIIPNLVVAEEFWAHSSHGVISNLEAGVKNRIQPLVLILTNAGTYRALAAREEYLLIERMCEGALPWRDDYLPLVFEVPDELVDRAMEKGEDGVYTKEARRLWRMANPSLGSGTVREDYIISELESGSMSDAKMEDKKREVFCYWPITLDAGELWLKYKALEKAEAPNPPEEVLKKSDLYLGLDLGDTRDFSALCLAWKLPDGNIHVQVRHFTPGGTVDERGERADVPLGTWARKCKDPSCPSPHGCNEHERIIETNPGGSTDYGIIADAIGDLVEKYRVRCVAFDRKFMYRVADELDRRDANLKFSRRGMQDVVESYRPLLVDHPQGGYYSKDENAMAMGRSMEAVEDRLGQETISFEPNPFLRWQTTCTTVRYANKAAGRKYLDAADVTKGATGWNDGWLAVCMAVGAADWKPVDAEGSLSELASMYEALNRSGMVQ